MNGLDYAIIVLVALGALYGLSQGALRMLTSIASVGCGIYFASLYYQSAAHVAGSQFGLSPLASAAVGYIVLFAAVFASIEIVGRLAMQLVHVVHLSWADRLAGSVLGAAMMAVVAGFTVMVLTALLPPGAPLLRNSTLAPRLLAYNRALVDYLPDEAKTAFEIKQAELESYWARGLAKSKAPGASPQASPTPVK
jgi:membrane protein required for colicin V production